jgi:hypothetical protein
LRADHDRSEQRSRIALLNSIGFNWRNNPPPILSNPGATTEKRAKRRSWTESFNRLKAYQAEAGHCNVTKKEDNFLNRWVSHERVSLRADHDRSEQSSRIALLNSIGFNWRNNPPPILSNTDATAKVSDQQSSNDCNDQNHLTPDAHFQGTTEEESPRGIQQDSSTNMPRSSASKHREANNVEGNGDKTAIVQIEEAACATKRHHNDSSQESNDENDASSANKRTVTGAKRGAISDTLATAKLSNKRLKSVTDEEDYWEEGKCVEIKY